MDGRGVLQVVRRPAPILETVHQMIGVNREIGLRPRPRGEGEQHEGDEPSSRDFTDFFNHKINLVPNQMVRQHRCVSVFQSRHVQRGAEVICDR